MNVRGLSLCALVAACLAVPVVALQPPRDVRRGLPVGRASISGRVLTDDANPEPLRRVRVTLNNTERTLGRTAITNDEGAFSFSLLPPGRYLVSGVKDGFVTVHHGARRPDRPGVSIALRAGEARTITLQLPVGSVITGTVTDSDGLPAPGIRVQAMGHRIVGGTERRLVPVTGQAGWTTDDRGEYRMFGLPPGDYIVAARPSGPSAVPLQVLSQREIRAALAALRDTRTPSQPGPARARPTSFIPEEPRRSVSLASVMYPGTTSMTHAATLTLGRGEHRAGIDIQLQHVAIARVQGAVFSPNGSAGKVIVSLLLPGADVGSSQPLEHFATTTANAEGTFSFAGVPPGHYTMLARTVPRSQQVDQWASTEIVVDGENITNVVLSLRDALTISGRIVFESEHAAPVNLSGLQLELPMLLAGTAGAPAPRAVLRLDSGGRFRLSGVVPGLYLLRDGRGIRFPVGSWWLKSVTIGAQDLLGAPLNLKQSADDAVVTFTDRTTDVSGTVRDGEGQPSPDGFVVVFGADHASWFPGSRRVAGARPSADGRYRFRNLPAGDYFIIAHDDVEDGEWADPALLARIARQAVRITIAEHGKIALDLVPPGPE